MSQGGFPPTAVQPYIQVVGANTTWAMLQPSLSNNTSLVLIHPNAIDNVLKSIQKDPAKRHMVVKIKIFAGKQSPTWAMNLSGSAIKLNDFSCTASPLPAGCNGGSRSYSAPRWWGSNYQAAYDRFQKALGAAYDGNPLISQVDSPRCMAVYTEPMVRPYDPWSLANLLNAGYTVPGDVACLEQEMISQASAFPHTHIAVNINPYEDIFWKSGAPARSADPTITKAIIDYCRLQLGGQCLLANSELGRASATPGSPIYSYMYPMLQTSGAHTSYEVDNPGYTQNRPLSLILDTAVSLGATSVEMTNHYLSSKAPSFFASYNQALISNVPSCTSATMSPSVASPQRPGTSITFTATSIGCSATPEYKFFIKAPGATWTSTTAYGTASWTWSTAGLQPGIYGVVVWVRATGASANYQAYSLRTFTLAYPTCSWTRPLTVSTGPAAPGAIVSWTGSSSGCPTPQYRFWVLPPGGTWTIAQDYSTSPWKWQTTGWAPGTYLIDVWARQAGSVNSYEAYGLQTFTLGSGRCISAGLTSSVGQPQLPGASITFTASSNGCNKPRYEFWLLRPGGNWIAKRGYALGTTWTWTTTGYPMGTYLVAVWVKQAGSTAAYDAYYLGTFTLALHR